MSARIEQRGYRQALICECCTLPYAYVQRNGTGLVLVIESKHNGQTHSNRVTPAELRALADEMEREG